MSSSVKCRYYRVFHHFFHSAKTAHVFAHYYPVRAASLPPKCVRSFRGNVSVFQYVHTAEEASALMQSMCGYLKDLKFLELASCPDFNGGQLSLF